MIFVDTNAWIHHIRSNDQRLVGLLDEQRVVTCDVVIGELMLGAGVSREVGDLLLRIPAVPSPSAAETRAYIERHPPVFAGSGVGWADAQIIVAGARAGARLYTSDRAAKEVWRALGFRLA